MIPLFALSMGLFVFGYLNRNANSDHPDNSRTKEDTRRFPATDPRLTFATPYSNVKPNVKYLGDTTCSRCHAAIGEKYKQHPMGRSIAAQTGGEPPERYDAAFHNPFLFTGVTYKVSRQQDQVKHSESIIDPRGNVLVEITEPIALTVGSGQNGRAYLIERAGALFASPITWYPKKNTWDLSPGYEKYNPHFGRPITPDCLFCHANYAEHIPGTTNRYRSPVPNLHSIGCERCHGPGELHVARHEKAEAVPGSDDTIVNPARLEHSLREAICQQCHLQGQQRILRRGLSTFDFRPGLPLHLFSSEFIKPPEESDTKFVGSVEQMYASQCFLKSTGSNKLGCISCHDPHTVPPPERKASFYRDRCLNCHKDKGCSLPLDARLKKEDSCYTCHMPPTGSNINHTTISDHRIVKSPQSMLTREKSAPTGAPLVHFHQNLLPTPDPESERDLGIALIQYADSLPPGDKLRAVLERALPYLEDASKRDEQDLPALEAKGNALWFLSRLNEAIGCFEQVLKVDPEREMTLYRAASLSLRLGRTDAAKEYAKHALAINPWRWEYHNVLARAYGQTGDWRASLQSCQEALKLNTLEPGTNRQLVLCYIRLGEKAKAQQAFDVLLVLIPSQAEELRRWYAQLTR